MVNFNGLLLFESNLKLFQINFIQKKSEYYFLIARVSLWAPIKSELVDSSFALRFHQVSKANNLLYLCFEKQESRPEQVSYFFVVFDESGVQQRDTLRNTRRLTNFLVHPSKKNVLFLVQNNEYLQIHFDQGINQFQSQFGEVNRILQAAFLEKGNYLVEVRQFEGVQIWDLLLQRKISANRDENFNLIWDEAESDQAWGRAPKSQIAIESMTLKDGRQSILM